MDNQSEVAQRDRRVISRGDFAAESQSNPHLSLEAFRADQDATVDGEVADPFER